MTVSHYSVIVVFLDETSLGSTVHMFRNQSESPKADDIFLS